jgi:CubicO group peptidase (beta-lactamase class C family)
MTARENAMVSALCTLGGVVAFSTLSLQAQTFPSAPREAAAARLDEYMSAAAAAPNHFTGSILVAKDGRPIISKGYGMADYELDVPNTPATVFRLASLSKAFTATAIMLLQERRKLNVEDHICRYLDMCPEAWQPITIKHLLTHTSGIPNYTSLPGYEGVAGQISTDEDVISRVRGMPLEFAPGDKFKYNNSGYHLLGMIIERISGESYENFIWENVFVPLGMTHSGRDVSQAIIKNRAAGYSMANGVLVNAKFQNMAAVGGEGGLYSTTQDMLIWDQSLYTESLLSHKSLEEMFTPFKSIYGYGWNITKAFDRKEIRHNGSIFGFAAQINRFPDDKVTVIVLSNNQMTDATKIGNDLSAIVFGASYRIPQTAKTIPASILQRYIGRYRFSPDMSVTVTLEGTKLFAQGTGQGKAELFASSEAQFFLANSDAQIRFQEDQDGVIRAMIVSKAGKDTRGERI